MSLKSTIINLYARRVLTQTNSSAQSALRDQEKTRTNLIRKAAETKFGKDHCFSSIKTAADFKKAIPVRGYEELKAYINLILAGQKDILWPGTPKYLAKTSGTTSGVKYIPISHTSIKSHIKTARTAILNQVAQGQSNLFDGKMIFISGSPELGDKSSIATGRLSGIVNHEIPNWVQGNQLPSFETNCISDWEEKLDAIVKETHDKDLRLISGIPPWVQMYYERLLAYTGKRTIKEVFPNLSLFIHGGVNFSPYAAAINNLHGALIPTLETYPASEGFIAYQDDLADEGLLLNTDAGLYFEFIPLAEIGKDSPSRLSLSEVKLDVDYALVISSDAGLWAYSIGDTIRFTSLSPFKIRVSGRVKHFISAFGEHVIGKEVDTAMTEVSKQYGLSINEFTVAPQVTPEDGGLPYHEWLIEFREPPIIPLTDIAQALDKSICAQNIYYRDLISSKILKPLVVTSLPLHSFRTYMKSIGKLGGQSKVPRLMNDRKIADVLRSQI